MKVKNFFGMLLIIVLTMATLSSHAQFNKLKNSVTKEVKKKTTEVPTDTKEATRKLEECQRHYDFFDEKEANIYRRIDENKPESAEMSLQAYYTRIEKIREALCPNVKKYEERVLELEALIKQAHRDIECGGITNDIEGKDLDVRRQIAQGVPSASILDNSIIILENTINEHKASGCFEAEPYYAKISEYKEQAAAAAISEDPMAHLSKAIYSGDKEQVDVALANGLGINDFNEHGNCPLFIAVQSGKNEMVEYILSKGADINIKNDKGRVAFDYGSENYIEMRRLLLSNGADPSLVNFNSLIYHLVESDEAEFLKELDNHPKIKFTKDEYFSCYLQAEEGTETEKYFAEKVKASTYGKTFDGLEAGMKDAALETEILQVVIKELETDYSKIKIKSSEWAAVRHPISGVVTARKIAVYAKKQTNDGVCVANVLIIKQYYNGESYGKSLYSGFAETVVLDCN